MCEFCGRTLSPEDVWRYFGEPVHKVCLEEALLAEMTTI